METIGRHLLWKMRNPDSAFSIVPLVCLVATLSYLVPKLEGTLISNPQTIWPLWPVCALLVPVLLLVPRRIWPILIPVAFVAFVLYDLQAGVPIRSIAWFIPADTVEVLIAAFGLSHFFGGVPRLNSVKALAKYSFFAVVLAPLAGAFLAAPGIRSDYWNGWRICFFSEMLAFLTLTPAILSWVSEGPAWVRKPRAYHLEAAALLAGLALLGYITFAPSEKSSSAVLLYSLVPFLLWSVLRFGSLGISTSVVVVTFLSIWGAVHGRSPFTDYEPLRSVFSLQLFLVFAATPFMVLAALVEERKRAERELRESEERLRLAMGTGKLGGWELDIKNGRSFLFGETRRLLGMPSRDHFGLAQDFWDRVHPEDVLQLKEAVQFARQNQVEFDQEFRVVWTDGSLHWLRSQGRFFYTPNGEAERMLGISLDITEQKRAEKTRRESEERFRVAAQAGNMFAYEWDAATDVIVRSGESVRILGIDAATSISGQQILAMVHADDRERLKATLAELTPEKHHLQMCYRMVRSDGKLIWVERTSRAHFDEQGKMLRIIGMVADVTARKCAEEALRKSEEWFRLAVQAGRMYAFEWDMTTDVIVRSGECAAILSWISDPTRDTSRRFVNSVHPLDREAYTAAGIQVTPENPAYKISYRVLRPDGSVIWLEVRGHALFDQKGRKLGVRGMVADVTERKLAEEALSSLSRRLIETQEQERTRIARELHDDLSQRMALLQIGLEEFDQGTTELTSKARKQLHNLTEVASEVSSDLHSISHRLHPAKLDLQGLVPATESFCRELSNKHELQIKFLYHDVPGQIPKDVALCLFRIVQEGLRNVVKHGKTSEAKVELSGHGDGIDLCISDRGVGFNVESAKGEAGLGLISMRERLRLVGGYLSVESDPSRGTRIFARAPLFEISVQTPDEAKEHAANA